MDENKTWNPLCYSVHMYKHWCFGRSTPMTPPPLLFCANPWLPPNTSHESRLATRLWSCKWLKPVYPSIRHPVQQFVMVTGQAVVCRLNVSPRKPSMVETKGCGKKEANMKHSYIIRIMEPVPKHILLRSRVKSLFAEGAQTISPVQNNPLL